MITAPPATNQNNPAHIPPGTPVSWASHVGVGVSVQAPAPAPLQLAHRAEPASGQNDSSRKDPATPVTRTARDVIREQ